MRWVLLCVLLSCGCIEAMNPAALPSGDVFVTFVNQTPATVCSLHLEYRGTGGAGVYLFRRSLAAGDHTTSVVSEGTPHIIARDCHGLVVSDREIVLRRGVTQVDVTP